MTLKNEYRKGYRREKCSKESKQRIEYQGIKDQLNLIKLRSISEVIPGCVIQKENYKDRDWYCI